MTNEEQLAKAYPKHIDRLRELCPEEFLKDETEHGRHPANTMAAGFDWDQTKEGWAYWNDLYESHP